MTEEPKYLARYDPNRDASANWKDADPLSFGWFGYSPSELQDRYRDSGHNLHRSKSLEFDMRLGVRHRIGDGGILAFGVQQLPELKIEAERIPTILFQSEDTKIDWESCRISGLGLEFHDVKICLCADSSALAEESISGVETNSKRRGGRPSQYPQAREVLQELYEEHPAYRPLSAARLLNTFNERYLLKFTPPGGRIAPVSERTLRDYLEDFRQELAKTGNN